MLLNLFVENFVLLDRLELDLSNGLCVITGETGAGKSLIVDAIEGLIGARLSVDDIKKDSKSSFLEATFSVTPEVKKLLRENSFDDVDDTVTLSRVIQKSGTKCRINGQIVTQIFLKQVGELLIDIIGQNENQFLFRVERHREIIDQLGNENHKGLCDDIKNIYIKLNTARKEFEELRKTSLENKRQIDFYKFQLNEITEAALVPGEEEELKKEREILVHAEELIVNLNRVYHELFSGEDFPSICDRLTEVTRIIDDSAKFDTELVEISNELEGLSSHLKDISRSIREHSELVESDPQKLDEVEDRLNIIIKMKNKYGQSVQEILKYSDELREKLSVAETSDDRLNELSNQISILEKEYVDKSELLSKSRKDISLYLEPKVEQELSELGMEKTKFKVNINQKKEIFSETGKDSVEFLISPNPGEPLRPLSKIVSGGESSRIMLSLRMVLREKNPVPTLIFDEIDSGISGNAALTVSKKLAKLSRFVQILCVTHLPVVAAMAEQHLWLEKSSTEEYTRVNIMDLTESIRFEKLAQMSGGKISKTSLKYARDIYKNATDYKKDFGSVEYSKN